MVAIFLSQNANVDNFFQKEIQIGEIISLFWSLFPSEVASRTLHSACRHTSKNPNKVVPYIFHSTMLAKLKEKSQAVAVHMQADQAAPIVVKTKAKAHVHTDARCTGRALVILYSCIRREVCTCCRTLVHTMLALLLEKSAQLAVPISRSRLEKRRRRRRASCSQTHISNHFLSWKYQIFHLKLRGRDWPNLQ